ncbi:MAG: ROK family protein [Gammaproteobacteria bacterium]|nr:MAG: ROK family protein [Gammaproteobacteria bacterium]TLY87756.1 MAG: ROK family protein [Gammaproteobacteria bacterium]
MTHPKPLMCGVELGGTKCECLVGTAPDDIRERITVRTERDAAATLHRIAGILRDWKMRHGTFSALGLACFGPLDLRPDSPDFGRIGMTPKEGWRNVDVAGFFADRFADAVGMTTDVIAAALAEGRWGAGRGLTDYAYVTVGTGIGAGLIAAGKPVFGWHPPEVGHIRIARAPGDDWPGNCRFHGACLEGLASGPAIEARTGTLPANLPADSPVWETVAHALAQLAHHLVLTLSPQRILIGGGVVSERTHLFPRIRERLRLSINDYLDIERAAGPLEEYIVPPGLGTLAGPLGALAVAADAGSSSSKRPFTRARS